MVAGGSWGIPGGRLIPRGRLQHRQCLSRLGWGIGCGTCSRSGGLGGVEVRDTHLDGQQRRKWKVWFTMYFSDKYFSKESHTVKLS